MSYLLDLSGGYLRVPRWLFDPQHPLSPAHTGEPATKREALLDLLALAWWKPGGRGDVNRGEARVAVSFLAERWGWSPTTVRRFLRMLHEDGAIRWHPGNGRERSTIRFPLYGALNPPPKGGAQVAPSDGTLRWHPPVAPSPSNNDAENTGDAAPSRGTPERHPPVARKRHQENQEVLATGKVDSPETGTNGLKSRERSEKSGAGRAAPNPDEDPEAFERWAIRNEGVPVDDLPW